MCISPRRRISENISILMFGLSNTLSSDSPLKIALRHIRTQSQLWGLSTHSHIFILSNFSGRLR